MLFEKCFTAYRFCRLISLTFDTPKCVVHLLLYEYLPVRTLRIWRMLSCDESWGKLSQYHAIGSANFPPPTYEDVLRSGMVPVSFCGGGWLGGAKQ